ncbi:MAG: hypothetical protein GXP42_06305 [Chloroflexi bacterium]|nr:hypothetical protein [Chloroflexota bacterium]
MSYVSVRAIFDGQVVRLLNRSPIREPYRVLVTFLEPASEESAPDRERFLASFGAWKDERPIEETLNDILDARRSKAEPPVL